jgi:hypothetical protein
MNPKPDEIANAAGVVKSNWLFEDHRLYLPPGVTVELTPSNDLSLVKREGTTIAVFNKNDGYSLITYLKGLST